MSEAEHDRSALDADALAMLRAYQSEERIPAEVHDRVWSRLRAEVEPSPVRWLRYAAVTGAIAAAAMAVLWMGGRLLRAEPRAPASQAGYEHAGLGSESAVKPHTPAAAAPREQAARTPPEPSPSPAIAPPSPTQTERAEPDAPTTGSGPATRNDKRPTTPRKPEAGEPAPDDTLAAETRLLAQARAALLEARPEQALARLAEHARRFPDGVLSEERQALDAVALCEAGRDADGESAARTFLREHPRAALAQRVRGACLED